MKNLFAVAALLCTTAAFAAAPSSTGLSTATPKKSAKISTRSAPTSEPTRVSKEKAPEPSK